MRDFQFFVRDDRYTVPSVVFVESRDVASARAAARRLLSGNAHYHSIEIRSGDEPLLIVVGRFSDIWSSSAA